MIKYSHRNNLEYAFMFRVCCNIGNLYTDVIA